MQVFVNISTGIVTEVTFTFAYFLYYYCTFLTCIGNNLTKRFLNSTLDNFDTGCFVFIIALQAFQCFRSTDVSYATARNDTFFDSCTSCMQSIVNTVGTNVKTFVDEQVSKFLLGERSFDEWDSYVAEVEALGLADLKAVHESSYARVLALLEG